MLNENGLTFKDFEIKTFEMICRLGREYTRDFLERNDAYLMENRDNEYPMKGSLIYLYEKLKVRHIKYGNALQEYR